MYFDACLPWHERLSPDQQETCLTLADVVASALGTPPRASPHRCRLPEVLGLRKPVPTSQTREAGFFLATPVTTPLPAPLRRNLWIAPAIARNA